MGRLSVRTGLRARDLRQYAPVGVLAAVWFLAKFGRALFPPLFPRFQALYGIGSTKTGLLFSVMMGVYGLMQFPSGVLADRTGPAQVIGAGLVVTAGAALLVAAAPSYVVLVVAAAAFGLGTGVHKTVEMKALSVIYPARRGSALGVLDTVGFVGSAVAPLALVALGRWRSRGGSRSGSPRSRASPSSASTGCTWRPPSGPSAGRRMRPTGTGRTRPMRPTGTVPPPTPAAGGWPPTLASSDGRWSSRSSS